MTVIHKFSPLVLLTLSQILWWGSLAVCYLVNPSVLNSGEVISLYGTFPETMWIFGFGLVSSGILTLVLASHLKHQKYLKITLIIVGLCSILLPFFRLNSGNVNFLFHAVFSGAIFFCEALGLLFVNLKLRKSYYKYFSAFMTICILVLFLSLGEIGILNLLLASEFAVPIIFGAWLQVIARREDVFSVLA